MDYQLRVNAYMLLMNPEHQYFQNVLCKYVLCIHHENVRLFTNIREVAVKLFLKEDNFWDKLLQNIISVISDLSIALLKLSVYLKQLCSKTNSIWPFQNSIQQSNYTKQKHRVPPNCYYMLRIVVGATQLGCNCLDCATTGIFSDQNFCLAIT